MQVQAESLFERHIPREAIRHQRRETKLALLRPIVNVGGQERIRDPILQAYAEHESDAAEVAR